MFWKRKSKKQDGQEATDSAAEVAAEKEETTSASEDEGAETTEKADAKAEKAEKKADAEDKDAGTEEATDSTEDGDESEKADAEDGDESEETDEAKDKGTGAEESEDEEDSEKDEKAEKDEDSAEAEDEAEEDKPVDVFDDEGEEAGATGPDSDGITRVRTVGVFEFDGEKHDLVNNTWIIEADDEGVVVIDPGHDAEAILEAVGKREIYLVACTNGYSPHIESAIKLAEESEAPIALHPREMRTWRRHHGAEHRPEIEVEGQGALDIGDLHIDVLALPGSSPGTVGYYISERGVVFSGDTLLKGEPGMVGNTYIDYTTQLASIGEALLSLPPDTRILPDRGPATTSAAESKNFDSWV